MSPAERLRSVADRQRIYAQMARYCQAIDRCDVGLLKSVFHADATVRFGIFDGNAFDFADYNIPFIKDNLVVAWHRFSNVSITLDGDRATAESYMLGNATAAIPGGEINCPDAMRYADHWEKRDGVWRMRSRDLIMDWNACWSYTGRTDGLYASFTHQGQRGHDDLAYQRQLVPMLPQQS